MFQRTEKIEKLISVSDDVQQEPKSKSLTGRVGAVGEKYIWYTNLSYRVAVT